MSDLPMLGRTEPPSVWKMYRAMVGVGLVSGLLIVTAYELTAPTIERNKAEALQRAIFEVLPEARSSRTFRLTEAGGFAALERRTPGDELVYAGYDATERLIGLAVEAQGMGYQDVIRLLYGYSFEQDAIVGLRVLESKETPGLGDKIQKDPAFLENFRRLDVSLGADLSHIANPIVTVKHGAKQHPWQVDGITGATISSVAVGGMLNRSSARWVPLIRKHLGDFERAGAETQP